MGQQIIKQTLVDGKPLVAYGIECEPGRYAVWSSIVDNFVLINATREELIEFHVEEAIRQVHEEIGPRIERADETGASGHPPFKKTFTEAVEWAHHIHGDDPFPEDEMEDTEQPDPHREQVEGPS